MIKAKWYHQINPCDIDRFNFLAPLGDALAALWDTFTFGTDCACCLGTRLTLLMILCICLGTML